jgi:hypothetical protein
MQHYLQSCRRAAHLIGPCGMWSLAGSPCICPPLSPLPSPLTSPLTPSLTTLPPPPPPSGAGHRPQGAGGHQAAGVRHHQGACAEDPGRRCGQQQAKLSPGYTMQQQSHDKCGQQQAGVHSQCSSTATQSQLHAITLQFCIAECALLDRVMLHNTRMRHCVCISREGSSPIMGLR